MRDGSLTTRQMRDGIVTPGFSATMVAVTVVATLNAVRCGSGAMRSLNAVTVTTLRMACFRRTASGLSVLPPVVAGGAAGSSMKVGAGGIASIAATVWFSSAIPRATFLVAA